MIDLEFVYTAVSARIYELQSAAARRRLLADARQPREDRHLPRLQVRARQELCCEPAA